MTAPDVAAIAAGLTKAMAETLMNPWTNRGSGVQTIMGSPSTRLALLRRGLVNRDWTYTVDGRVVRAHLLAQEPSA